MRGSAHLWSISFMMALSSTSVFSSEWDNLLFPLSIIASKSDFRISCLIGSRL